MIVINSLNDVEKFFHIIWQELNRIITDLIAENNYHKNDLDDIYDFIKRYLEHGKKDMTDEIKKGKTYSIPEQDFMLDLASQFEENIQGQGLFRSILLLNGNRLLKEIIERIRQNKFRYSG